MTPPALAEGTAIRLPVSPRHTLSWLLKACLRPLRRRSRDSSRFVLASPPFHRTQVIYDEGTGSRFSVAVRNESDLGIVGQVFEGEAYRLERLQRHAELVGVYDAMCARNEVPFIVDCGANIGLASAYFARIFPRSHIVAIEPDPANIALAKLNCAAHSQVEFIHAGVANEPGMATLVDPKLGSDAYRTTLNDDGNIALVSINDLAADAAASNCRPFIVKIDIEGFENNLFAAHVEWVNRFPLLIIELHDWLFPGEANSRNFLKCIAALDRDFVHIGENIFSVRNGAA